MTYGEAHTIVKCGIEMIDGKWKSLKLPKCRSRMSRDEAGKYYTEKINEEFKRLGYRLKSDVDYSDFRTADEYFDYFEALKIYNKLFKC